MTPSERSKRKANGEQSAREARSGRLPDWHTAEVQRRTEEGAQIRAENAIKGLDPQGQQVRDIRCKCSAQLPDSRGRFG